MDSDKLFHSVLLIQKTMRGYLQRKKTRVKTIAPGVVHIHIKGYSEIFKAMGIDEIQPTPGMRTIDILSIKHDKYQGRIVGGNFLFNTVKSSPGENKKIFGPGTSVYINAGFFNTARYYDKFQEYTPIGPSKTETANKTSGIPIPKEYINDYRLLKMSDDHYICTAPLLACDGQLAIEKQKLNAAKYNYQTLKGRKCPPGSLFHSGDPNPRSAIAIPGEKNENKKNKSLQDRVRFVTAITTNRGKQSNGFTMFEWAHILTKISKQNSSPGSALNLDGGDSVTMGIVDNDGKKKFEVYQNVNGRENATFITYTLCAGQK